nr:MAG TPA: hypothetical protein [Caudoviricetes sp.]
MIFHSICIIIFHYIFTIFHHFYRLLSISLMYLHFIYYLFLFLHINALLTKERLEHCDYY